MCKKREVVCFVLLCFFLCGCPPRTCNETHFQNGPNLYSFAQNLVEKTHKPEHYMKKWPQDGVVMYQFIVMEGYKSIVYANELPPPFPSDTSHDCTRPADGTPEPVNMAGGGTFMAVVVEVIGDFAATHITSTHSRLYWSVPASIVVGSK